MKGYFHLQGGVGALSVGEIDDKCVLNVSSVIKVRYRFKYVREASGKIVNLLVKKRKKYL